MINRGINETLSSKYYHRTWPEQDPKMEAFLQQLKALHSTGVHAKSNATSRISILVTESLASTILASYMWFAPCSFGLHIWFV